jgi:trehalose 6-phosphate phosphatase
VLPASRTPAGEAGLAALVGDPATALLTLDYDGTLSPIATRPEDAVPAPGALAALTACTKVFGTVAIVTGRPAAVVVSLAGAAAVDNLVILGHYGEERWTAAGGLVAPPEHPGLPAARRLLAERLQPLYDRGVRVEEKGLSLAVHTRASDDPEGLLARARDVVLAVAGETRLDVNHGRFLVELRAPGAADKKTAIRSLVAERSPKSVLFAGDDLVDLPAYEAVAEFRAAGGLGVGVFVDNPEAASVRAMADVVLPDTAACVRFLADLAAAAHP